MTTVFLVRHAACDHVGRTIAGWSPGVHLNAAGREEAQRLARRLASVALEAVYTSPLERARETAELLAADRTVPIHVAEAFGEIRFGDWTGRTLEGLEGDERWRDWNAFRSGTRAPGGEMMVESIARAVGELERLCRRHPSGAIAVVTHGDVIRAIVAHYAGIPLDLFLRLEIDPASVSVLALERWGPKLLRLNDTGELPA